jgi:uncharacterized LabA/DUF88 family protein
MNFIDGRYLARCLNEIFGDETINFRRLSGAMGSMRVNDRFVHEVIRSYYYDFVPSGNNDESPEAKAVRERKESYLRLVKNSPQFQIRLGRWKSDGKGNPKLKGLDTLIAIDMISKAWQNQYDIAIVMTDSVELIGAISEVKEAGKRVYGVFMTIKHFAPLLHEELDNTVIMSPKSVEEVRT